MARLSQERLRLLVINALIVALALALPVVFHAVGLGSRFLPLLLPLVINGFLSPPGWAALAGAVAPLASAAATGMPPLYPPVALVMSVEGALLGGVAALLYRASRRRVWCALVPAILCGRAAAFGLSWILARQFGLPPAMTGAALIFQGLPGVALQLTVAPLVVRALGERSGPLFEHGEPG